MPARDRFHSQVRNALIQDGWTITHDPLRLRWGMVVFDPQAEVIQQWIP